MVNNKISLLWIRNDFRLRDNLALLEASKYKYMIPFYIWDESDTNLAMPGSASKWWLHQSLNIFQEKLQKKGSNLLILKGKTEVVFEQIIKEFKTSIVIWNRSYNPKEADKVKSIQKLCKKFCIDTKTYSGNTLCSKDFLLKKDGTPYLVYTPFWKNFLSKYKNTILNEPKTLPPFIQKIKIKNFHIKDLNLLPKIKWYNDFEKYWKPGEDSAYKIIENFIKNNIISYKIQRDIPSQEGTSLLSPHLHFGEIHPHRVLFLIEKKYGALKEIKDENIIQFVKEIIWREFSYHLLQHFPHIINQPLRPEFKNFPWKKNKKLFTAWTRGQTGYPIVDAGMRQLWQTGWMHNRVRMITASFLIKHLNISWQEGAHWFWDTLVDADIASNTQGWQWTAGCGADAAPFFRIFNPITQGEKFDPNGTYIRKWCPELSKLPNKFISKPWEASTEILLKAGINLGTDYPKPIVNHSSARNQALMNYEFMRKK